MVGKNIFVLFIAVIVNVRVIHGATCRFSVTTSGYECLLLNQTIQSDEDMMIIDGSHEIGFTDANVTILRASYSFIRIFPSLIVDHFENLNFVDLLDVKMELFTRPITNCNALYSVKLGGNEITTFSGGIFRNCGDLRDVNLVQNGLRFLDSAAFAGTNITSLYLHDNDIEFLQPGMFVHIPFLESLFINNNSIREILPGTFNSTQRLRFLALHKNKLSSWSAHNLPELSQLYLSDNQITTISSDSFANMPKLTMLDLTNNSITEIPSFQGLHELYLLNMMLNRVTHLHSEAFNGLQNLQHLYLSYNELVNINFTNTDENFLPNAIALYFDVNQLTSIDGFILPANVTSIDFSGNKLTHLTANSIQPISRLRFLRIENNEIRRIDREFFNDAVNLTVYMENNHCFSDTIMIRDRYALEEDGLMLERCFSHATNFVSSIAVLVASVSIYLIFF